MLELKVQSLHARGEFTPEERDRLLQALQAVPPPPRLLRRRLMTPVRLFLAGVIVGVGLAYLVWFRLWP